MTSLRHNPASAPAITTAGPAASDAYLDAARECLLDVGWRRTTLTEVARRAGVSRMTIYRTWADMDRLMADLMLREWSSVIADALSVAPTEADDVDRLVGVMVAVVEGLRTNDLFVRIMELDPELLLPYLLDRRGRSQDSILGLVAGQVHAAESAGTARAGNPIAMARALLLTCHGFTLSLHTMVDDDVTQTELDAELRHLLSSTLRKA